MLDRVVVIRRGTGLRSWQKSPTWAMIRRGRRWWVVRDLSSYRCPRRGVLEGIDVMQVNRGRGVQSSAAAFCLVGMYQRCVAIGAAEKNADTDGGMAGARRGLAQGRFLKQKRPCVPRRWRRRVQTTWMG